MVGWLEMTKHTVFLFACCLYAIIIKVREHLLLLQLHLNKDPGVIVQQRTMTCFTLKQLKVKFEKTPHEVDDLATQTADKCNYQGKINCIILFNQRTLSNQITENKLKF